MKINLLQKYLFIPLDIFGEKIHNEGVTDEIGAWLAFLSQDDPEIIIRLIRKYPEFRAMYEEVYRICRNMEDIMGIFSEELRILDENTIDNMIDDMREENEQLREEMEQLRRERQNLAEENRGLAEKNQNLGRENSQKEKEISQKDDRISLLEAQSREERTKESEKIPGTSIKEVHDLHRRKGHPEAGS